MTAPPVVLEEPATACQPVAAARQLGEPSATASGNGLAQPPPRTLERGAQIAIMLVIGTAAGAGSFRHVHDLAAAHGQAGWLAWSDAVVLELMSVAAGLELRRRKRTHTPVTFPAAVMATAVILSLGAQVADAEPSTIGWIAAAIPALGFLSMVKIALAQAGAPAPPAPPVASSHLPEAGGPRRTPPAQPAPQDPIVELLVPAARAAAAGLTRQGRRVSRHALAEVLRADGHAVSNARTSALLALLKAESGETSSLHVLADSSSCARGIYDVQLRRP